METIEAVNQSNVLLLKAVSGHIDPHDIPYDLISTLSTAALNWAMVEEAMKARPKESIQDGDYHWVRPTWRARWEIAEFKKTQCGLMCFTFESADFVDDKFMKENIIGGKIVLPPDADI
jgi:membrane carboxypeptidase/penicillin-binding protein